MMDIKAVRPVPWQTGRKAPVRDGLTLRQARNRNCGPIAVPDNSGTVQGRYPGMTHMARNKGIWLTMIFNRIAPALLAAGLVAGTAGSAIALEEVNIYSSRHYDTDEALYSDFTKQTGIEINRIEGNADELIARIQNEGANSPADILITVDAGRIWQAQQKGLFQPVASDYLTQRIPAHLRHPDGLWFGFSKRARIIFYDKTRVRPSDIQTYESLADPKLKGLICSRSSGSVYMLSLGASIIEHDGPEKAKAWAQGLLNNLARPPVGGDTEQLTALASGECAIALANTYYYARALRSPVRGLEPEKRANIAWVFPNQNDRGAHVNISGAGVLRNAPNKDNAVKFLEYLAGDSAQAYFSAGNDEYPVVPGVAISPSVAQLGPFQQDTLNLEALGRNQPAAQRMYDEVGFK